MTNFILDNRVVALSMGYRKGESDKNFADYNE